MVTKVKTARKHRASPPLVTEEPEAPVKWFLCPQCRGKGEVPSDVRRKMARGVFTIGHNICPSCQGRRMVRSNGTSPGGEKLLPIKRCPTCRNWYAIGGGKPASEPCYQDHARDSHCHWHDLSMYPPPVGETV